MIISPIPGVAVTRNPHNGAAVIVIHYTADQKKDRAWAEDESRIYPDGMQSVDWLQEYEIDFEAELRYRTYYAYDADRNIVPAFPVPQGWPLSLGFDFGTTSPTAVLFFAQNPETSELIVFDEIYIRQTATTEISRMIYEVLATHLNMTMSAFTFDAFVEQSVGDPQGSAFALEYGQDPWPVPIQTRGLRRMVGGGGAGKKWRHAAEAKTNEAFALSFTCCGVRWYINAKHSNTSGPCGTCKKIKQGAPLLTIMEGRAPNLTRTLPTILRVAPAKDEAEPIEKDDPGQEDHAPDALVYRIMAAYWTTPQHEQKKDILNAAPGTLSDTEILQKARLRAAYEKGVEEMQEQEEDVIYADDSIYQLFEESEGEGDYEYSGHESVIW